MKEEITFKEFTSWLTGLIRGKNGELPDLDDWKEIKSMLDKVKPDVIEKYIEVPVKEMKLPYYSPEIRYNFITTSSTTTPSTLSLFYIQDTSFQIKEDTINDYIITTKTYT